MYSSILLVDIMYAHEYSCGYQEQIPSVSARILEHKDIQLRRAGFGWGGRD